MERLSSSGEAPTRTRGRDVTRLLRTPLVRTVARSIPVEVRPRHVGVIMDGNRRWARARRRSARAGHRAGAAHVEDLLGWAERWSIDHLSVYVLSADNIRRRDPDEVAALFELISTILPETVARTEDWALHLSGQLELLPPRPREALLHAATRTSGRPRHVTMAIGYDARADITEAVRAALRAGGLGHAGAADLDTIGSHFAGGPVKDIDLVIRSGGDHRISGFFPWQSAHAEVYFSRVPWPAFDELEFVRALRHFARARARLRAGRAGG